MNRKVTTSAAHSKNHPTGKSGIPFTRLPYRATELPLPPLHEVPAPVSRLPASEATPAAAFHLPSGVFLPWEVVRPFLPDDAASCFPLFPFLPSGTTCKSSCTASPSGKCLIHLVGPSLGRLLRIGHFFLLYFLLRVIVADIRTCTQRCTHQGHSAGHPHNFLHLTYNFK